MDRLDYLRKRKYKLSWVKIIIILVYLIIIILLYFIPTWLDYNSDRDFETFFFGVSTISEKDCLEVKPEWTMINLARNSLDTTISITKKCDFKIGSFTLSISDWNQVSTEHTIFNFLKESYRNSTMRSFDVYGDLIENRTRYEMRLQTKIGSKRYDRYKFNSDRKTQWKIDVNTYSNFKDRLICDPDCFSIFSYDGKIISNPLGTQFNKWFLFDDTSDVELIYLPEYNPSLFYRKIFDELLLGMIIAIPVLIFQCLWPCNHYPKK